MAIRMNESAMAAMREQLLATLLPSAEQTELTALQSLSCASDCITVTEAVKRLKGRNNYLIKPGEEGEAKDPAKSISNWSIYYISGQKLLLFWQNYQN